MAGLSEQITMRQFLEEEADCVGSAGSSDLRSKNSRSRSHHERSAAYNPLRNLLDTLLYRRCRNHVRKLKKGEWRRRLSGDGVS